MLKRTTSQLCKIHLPQYDNTFVLLWLCKKLIDFAKKKKKKKKKKKANHGGNLDSANILAVLVEEISSAIFQIVHRNL